jgi:hypothetical protein
MTEINGAVKRARLLIDNPTHWDDSIRQAYEELADENEELAKRAFDIFDKKMEEKRKRSEAMKQYRREQKEKEREKERQENNQQPHGFHQAQ